MHSSAGWCFGACGAVRWEEERKGKRYTANVATALCTPEGGGVLGGDPGR